MTGFYCVAPSCAYMAETGSQYCAAHNGKSLQWFTVVRPDGSRKTVRAESQEAANAA